MKEKPIKPRIIELAEERGHIDADTCRQLGKEFKLTKASVYRHIRECYAMGLIIQPRIVISEKGRAYVEAFRKGEI